MSTEPIRVQLRRSKGWRMPPNTVKVSRPSIWGNPFNATQCGVVLPWTKDGAPIAYLRTEPSIERCLDLYTAHLRTMLMFLPNLLVPLRGKNLACWCALNEPCHADILLKFAPYPFDQRVILEPFEKGEHGIRFPQLVQ